MTCEIPLTPRSKAILTKAHDITKAMNEGYIGPKHLIMAILMSDLGDASLILSGMSLSQEKMAAKVKEMIKLEHGIEL